MRYTVHTHRTFHHRITKYLGVLVAAALVATLGLPSAAQAQTPAGADGVRRRNDRNGFKVRPALMTTIATWIGGA